MAYGIAISPQFPAIFPQFSRNLLQFPRIFSQLDLTPPDHNPPPPWLTVLPFLTTQFTDAMPICFCQGGGSVKVDRLAARGDSTIF